MRNHLYVAGVALGGAAGGIISLAISGSLPPVIAIPAAAIMVAGLVLSMAPKPKDS